ncbi:MAG: transposase [Acetobacteraceae bacterium]|nr:transposase [Acetobacteraceae bacterium]
MRNCWRCTRLALHKESALSRLLAGVPGAGRLTAISLALTVDAAQFRSGRHFSAFLGLTPKPHSTGGKTRLGGISRGDQQGRHHAPAHPAGDRRRRGDPPRPARQPPGQRLAPGIAGAQAAPARGGGAGQQDGPHPLGHDVARRGLPRGAAGAGGQ